MTSARGKSVCWLRRSLSGAGLTTQGTDEKKGGESGVLCLKIPLKHQFPAACPLRLSR
jgi:hypothetical protein